MLRSVLGTLLATLKLVRPGVSLGSESNKSKLCMTVLMQAHRVQVYKERLLPRCSLDASSCLCISALHNVQAATAALSDDKYSGRLGIIGTVGKPSADVHPGEQHIQHATPAESPERAYVCLQHGWKRPLPEGLMISSAPNLAAARAAVLRRHNTEHAGITAM